MCHASTLPMRCTGQMYTHFGSFIEAPAFFDAQFFGISAEKLSHGSAASSLEVAWKLRDACIPPPRLAVQERERSSVSQSDYLQ